MTLSELFRAAGEAYSRAATERARELAASQSPPQIHLGGEQSIPGEHTIDAANRAVASAADAVSVWRAFDAHAPHVSGRQRMVLLERAAVRARDLVAEGQSGGPSPSQPGQEVAGDD